MKEKIEKLVRSRISEELRKVEEEMKRDGWQLKTVYSATILAFEREIPEQFPPITKEYID